MQLQNGSYKTEFYLRILRIATSSIFKLAIFKIILVKILMISSCVPANVIIGEYEIKIVNDYYEIGFSKSNGNMLYIMEKKNYRYIVDRDQPMPLWEAFFEDGSRIASTNQAIDFKYEWNPDVSVLTLAFKGEIDVDVAINVLEENVLRFHATVSNNNALTIEAFSFPGGISFNKLDMIEGLIPLMPGAILTREFFVQQNSIIFNYPGELFADYTSVRTANGNITIYSVGREPLNPVKIGFESTSGPKDVTNLVRKWKCWILEGKAWKSPEIVINIGDGYQETISDYRMENDINDFPDIRDKLGVIWERFSQSPLYKLDIESLGRTFEQIKRYHLDDIHIPGVLHLVAFQKEGHDHNYPVFIPADKRWGETHDLISLVEYAQNRGHLVIPYTNFSWWNVESPIMANLPKDLDIADIAVIRHNNNPLIERYNDNTGIVVNLHNDFVINTIDRQHALLIKLVGVDAIFEDQWGVRNAMFDFNMQGLHEFDISTSYFEGVLNHVRRHKDHLLITEQGVDVLAEYLIAFMGTNLLWDKIEFRIKTAPYTRYFPMAGMLLRDKVMLYQHNLALETFTDSKDIFRWNLAYGYSFSGYAHNNQWLNLIGTFQKNVMSRYKEQLVETFEVIENDITRTTFADHVVYANWNENISFEKNNHHIAPGGAAVFSIDNSLVAGAFTKFNNVYLTVGDHYIIEMRYQNYIKLFHPEGHDTKITLRKPKNWNNIKIHAYSYDKKLLFEHELINSDHETITFRSFGRHLLPQVYFYLIFPNDT